MDNNNDWIAFFFLLIAIIIIIMMTVDGASEIELQCQRAFGMIKSGDCTRYDAHDDDAVVDVNTQHLPHDTTMGSMFEHPQ